MHQLTFVDMAATNVEISFSYVAIDKLTILHSQNTLSVYTAMTQCCVKELCKSAAHVLLTNLSNFELMLAGKRY